MIVAIDGPAGVGKSTIAQRIADRNNLFYLNSGNFYRALTLKVIQEEIVLSDHQAIAERCRSVSLAIKEGHLYANDEDVEDQLHTDSVDSMVAQVSAIPDVRHYVNEQLRKVGSSLDVIAEGRDITTIVFPDAEVKCYFDASPEIRAQRRADQGVSSLSYEEILTSIKERDAIDKGKEFGGLKIADDALYLDTSALTIDQVCEKVTTVIKARKKESGVS